MKHSSRPLPFMMNFRLIRYCVLLLLVLAAAMAHGDPLPLGKGCFQFQDSKVVPGKPITVWFYRPATHNARTKVLFVMHGTHRNGEHYLDHWAKYAEKYAFLLLVPEFPKQDFSEAEYQFGGVTKANVEQWTFSVIERLFDDVKARAHLNAGRYYLYGHSAGAQFVHRYMIFMPEPRVALAIAANAGSYTLPIYPSWGQSKFPWSLDKSLVDEARLKSVFSRNLIVLLGEEDTDPHHPELPKSPQAKAQGNHRFERGQNFYRVAREQAARQKTSFNWRLLTVPGVAHSDSGMAKAAVRYIVEDDPDENMQ